MPLLLGCLIGFLGALCSRPLLDRLPAGIPERVTQPSRITERAGGPLLGVVGGAIGGAVAFRVGWHPPLAPSLWLAVLMPPIVIIDVQHRVIPELLTIPGATVGYELAVWAEPARAAEFACAAVVGGAVVTALVLADPGGMGMGDAKLVLLLGALLGRGLVVAVVVGGLVLVPSVLLAVVRHGRRGLAATVPLAPFLACGVVVTLLAPP